MTWDEVIDYHLIEFGRPLDNGGLSDYPQPSRWTVTRAISLAQDFRDHSDPEPTGVGIDNWEPYCELAVQRYRGERPGRNGMVQMTLEAAS